MGDKYGGDAEAFADRPSDDRPRSGATTIPIPDAGPNEQGATTMSDISPIQRPPQTTLDGLAKQFRPQAPAQAQSRGSDRVELSDHARYLGKLRELPPIREGLVESVRAQIDADTYETSDRIDQAIDALVDDLL